MRTLNLFFLTVSFFHPAFPTVFRDQSSLLQESLKRIYEIAPDGKESCVLLLSGLESFYKEVVEGKKPTVLRLTSSIALDRQVGSAEYQELAKAHTGFLRFVSVEAAKSPELLNYFLTIFLALLMAQSKSPNADKNLTKQLMGVLEYFSKKDTRKGDLSISLFFDGGEMLMTEKFINVESKDLSNYIEKHLIKKSNDGLVRVRVSSSQDQGSVWSRIKSRVKGFFN